MYGILITILSYGIIGKHSWIILPLLFVLLFLFIGEWKFFKKTGKKGWECLIPIYGDWVLLEVAGLNKWWIIMACISDFVNLFENVDSTLVIIASICNLIASLCCFYNLSKKFNLGIGYVVEGLLFGGFAIAALGFGKKYIYDEKVQVSKNGIF